MSDEHEAMAECPYTFKSVDKWLATQTPFERLKWSVIYLSDAYVDIFNYCQDLIFGKHSRAASRAIAAFTAIVLPLSLGVWLYTH